jgi:hypothetical protein
MAVRLDLSNRPLDRTALASSCASLSVLDLDGTGFRDGDLTALGLCTCLQRLYLARNKLHAPVFPSTLLSSLRQSHLLLLLN